VWAPLPLGDGDLPPHPLSLARSPDLGSLFPRICACSLRSEREFCYTAAAPVQCARPGPTPHRLRAFLGTRLLIYLSHAEYGAWPWPGCRLGIYGSQYAGKTGSRQKKKLTCGEAKRPRRQGNVGERASGVKLTCVPSSALMTISPLTGFGGAAGGRTRAAGGPRRAMLRAPRRGNNNSNGRFADSPDVLVSSW
jgi:hypothetical protein